MAEQKASVKGVYIADEEGSFVTKALNLVKLAFGGIPGDRHFGWTKKAGVRESMYERGTEIFNRRQLTLVSVEECAQIAEALGVDRVEPEWLGANVCLEGMPDLTEVPAGARFLFDGGAGLLCEGVARPCVHPGKVIAEHFPGREKLAAKFVKAASGRRGLIAVVEREGEVKRGDSVRIVT
ncbi:MAG TPA: MOSC domain-containing protein [Bacillales bacterium]|nr:MOSC domain-containing protein [Bacillales bacterium]